MFNKFKAIKAIKKIESEGKIINSIELSKKLGNQPIDSEAILKEMINTGYLISIKRGYFSEYKTSTKLKNYYIDLLSDAIRKWIPITISIISLIFSIIALINSGKVQ